MHELGHALGLDHSQSKASVMYPITQGVSQLSAGDIAGLKAIYGSR
ncbi:putative Zn-dependent protease [Lacticaseibacillus casei A2-362]|nr:putative Zn-dependent protease [Lacticaseibacillus casei A2-362]